MTLSRRALLAGALAAPLARAAASQPAIVFFSKPIDRLSTAEMARLVKDAGYEGVDLTVRPKGHIEPGSAAKALPQAIKVLRDAGLSVPMITTGFTAPGDAHLETVLATAREHGVRFVKPGYIRYKDKVDPELGARMAWDGFGGIAKLAHKHGLTLGLHNHSGDYVGGQVWDYGDTVERLANQGAGYYFDPCHATIEGGLNGWRLQWAKASKHLAMIALKDFRWQQRDGKWRDAMCPLGEGHVDWTKFFAGLKTSGFSGPVTVHIEYDPQDVAAAAKRDREFVKARFA